MSRNQRIAKPTVEMPSSPRRGKTRRLSRLGKGGHDIRVITEAMAKKLKISRGGMRNMTKRLGPLPKNVEFLGFVKNK